MSRKHRQSMTYLHLKREKARLKKVRKLKQHNQLSNQIKSEEKMTDDYTIPSSDWINK